MRKKIIIVILFFCLLEAVHAQKGETSFSAGLFISIPFQGNSYFSSYNFNTGLGLEPSGQYQYTDNSALVIQSELSSYTPTAGIDKITLLSLKGGYSYQLTNSGFYTNALGGIVRESGAIDRRSGIDSGLANNSLKLSFTLGARKRFIIKQTFIDAGIDYISGDEKSRINIKAIISLFRTSSISQAI